MEGKKKIISLVVAASLIMCGLCACVEGAATENVSKVGTPVAEEKTEVAPQTATETEEGITLTFRHTYGDAEEERNCGFALFNYSFTHPRYNFRKSSILTAIYTGIPG